MTTTDSYRDQDVDLPPPGSGPRLGLLGWSRWAWRRLTSMRTAVLLLAMLALAAVPGSLLPQRGVASDPSAVPNYFLEHPDLAPWLDRLWLFEVYAAPWFASIYLLLLVSMTGCVLPRSLKLWRECRADPVAAPRSLSRLEVHRRGELPQTNPAAALDTAAAALRARRFRVTQVRDEVRAEKGYLREFANLLFHLSLLVLLLGVAVGRLFGFEGRVALPEGQSFTNAVAQYDAFTPSALTDVGSLEDLSFTLRSFSAEFETDGLKRGEPRGFTAMLDVQANGEQQVVKVEPNHPLDINGTKAFLTGHGYAPVITVRDGNGDIAFSGPVIFFPTDGSFASDGIVKVPDALPEQLGFEGLFLPTAATGTQGPISASPDPLNPQLLLSAYVGDLGLDSGTQSVFTLDKSQLRDIEAGGKPVRESLAPGETWTLPDGLGSITFDRVSRFANFQIAYDPGKEISLLAAILLLIGVSGSLLIPRRRIWVRVDPSTTNGLEGAATSLTRRRVPPRDVALLERVISQESETS